MKKKHAYIIIIILIIASCTAFGRIAGNDFINFDDNEYITGNNHIKSGINAESVNWAFTTTYYTYWHPLTWLSHMLDWSLFGTNPSGHHLVSLLLHIGAVIFLFLFLNKTTNNIWASAFAAAFFALHPLRVESVAWASERKDVLSMFFGMASIYAYAFYAERTKISRYFLCLILFILSLTSKPMLVTLPFVLLLLDYWPLGRWQMALSAPVESRFKLTGRIVWEKIPFFILTIATSIAAIWAQNNAGAMVKMENLPFVKRFSNAILSYAIYLGKIFWPHNLAVYNPYDFSLPLWKVLISGIIIIFVTIAEIYHIKKTPSSFVGWFWYLGTLIPVIGLVQVGTHAMADRHTYLPSVGIAIMLAWGIESLIMSENIRKNILFPAVIAFIIITSVLTWQQCGYWKNSITLFSHALQVTKDNYLAHNNIALSLSEEGKITEALYHYNEAIRLKPYYAYAYNNRGILYAKLGQYKSAIDDFNKAVQFKEDCFEAYFNLGRIYSNTGKYQSAIENYNKAITLRPDNAYVYNNIGIINFKQGDNNLGCHAAQKACSLGMCKLLEFASIKGYCR